MDTIPPAVDTHVPRGPNFSLVVALAVSLLFIILIAAYLLLHHAAHNIMPQSPGRTTSLFLR